jgi:hypothetical protein
MVISNPLSRSVLSATGPVQLARPTTQAGPPDRTTHINPSAEARPLTRQVTAQPLLQPAASNPPPARNRLAGKVWAGGAQERHQA